MVYKNLSIKQKKFVDAYVSGGNATQAARQAGYSPKSARVQGASLLTYANVRAAIDERIESLQNSKVATAAEILEFLTSVMRGETVEKVVISTPKDRGKFTTDLIERPPLIIDRLHAAQMLSRIMHLERQEEKAGVQDVIVYIPENGR